MFISCTVGSRSLRPLSHSMYLCNMILKNSLLCHEQTHIKILSHLVDIDTNTTDNPNLKSCELVFKNTH